MKRSITLITVLAALIVAGRAWGWEWMPLGGGNAEKIVICEDPDGVWFFGKDGGAFWIPRENNDWGEWKVFDAHYCWQMGGDVCVIDGTPYALNVTMQGHHYYQWDGDSWEYYDFLVNDYYCYHDAQFFADDQGNTNVNWFLVTTWQTDYWKHYDGNSNTYRRAIYLVDNGQAPPADITQANYVSGTEDKTYGKIYRDLEDPQVFYTWYSPPPEGGSIDFQKVEVSGTEPPFNATLDELEFNETGYTLMEVAGFYQYSASSDRHQYLLAKTRHDLDTQTWDVWYRHEDANGNLNATDWQIIQEDVLNPSHWLAAGW